MERSSVQYLIAVVVLVGIIACQLTVPVQPVYGQELTGNSPIYEQTIAVTRWEPVGEAATEQEWLRDSLRTLITEDFSRITEINVVESSEYRNRLSENELDDLNPNNNDNAREIAGATRADVLLIGTYQLQDNRIQLSAVFYDPFSEETLAAHSELGELRKIKSLETKLARRILRKGGITLGASEINWLNRDKTITSDEISFDEPESRPDILERDDRGTSGETLPEGLERRELIVGLHYPGFSLGYQPTLNSTLEFRFEKNSDINVIGGRYNYHFFRFGYSNLYTGFQVSHIDFEGEVTEGTGLLGGGFLGFEEYATPTLSFKADVGTYFTTLEDDATGVSESGIGFSVVTGLALHFY